MFHLITAFVFIVIAWKWGDWRNWKLYYPTIIFMILGDFVHLFLTFQKPLWIIESPLLGRTFSNLILAFIIYPSFNLIYLFYFPRENLKKQVLYIVALTLFFVGFEYLAFILSNISYHNGWNLLCSLLFDLMIFPLLWVHYKKPLLGVSFAAVIGTCIMLFFKIPLPR